MQLVSSMANVVMITSFTSLSLAMPWSVPQGKNKHLKNNTQVNVLTEHQNILKFSPSAKPRQSILTV